MHCVGVVQQMIIALDYDETFTRDPVTWMAVMKILRERGHTVIGVTMRYVRESLDMHPGYAEICDTIYFTARSAKRDFLGDLGVIVDVWIDDAPEFILHSARGHLEES